MEKLTENIKHEITAVINDIIDISTDLKNLLKRNLGFIDGKEETTFYRILFKSMADKILYTENILTDKNRRLLLEVGQEFLDWAEDYFDDRFNFNKTISFEEAMDRFNLSCKRHCSVYEKSEFVRKLQLWCEIKGYIYNPEEIMRYKSAIERQRNEIRFEITTFDRSRRVWGFYIGKQQEEGEKSHE